MGKIKWYILSPVLVAIAVVITLVLLRPSYRLSQEETLSEILKTGHVLSPEAAARLIEAQDPAYTFIDIRLPADFEAGHLEGALNIPARDLFDEDNLRLFGNSGQTCVLYGDTELEANGPWMLLRQLDYRNVKVLQGGYAYFLARQDSTGHAAAGLPEGPRFDYAAVHREAVAAEKKALEAKPVPAAVVVPAAQKRIVPKPKPKVEKEEEGC